MAPTRGLALVALILATRGRGATSAFCATSVLDVDGQAGAATPINSASDVDHGDCETAPGRYLRAPAADASNSGNALVIDKAPAGWIASGGESLVGGNALNIARASLAASDATTPAYANAGVSACAAGMFSASEGSSACADCDPGRYAANAGSSACDFCPSGRYAANAGSSACTDCAVGTFAAAAGSNACAACPVGTTSASGSSACAAIAASERASLLFAAAAAVPFLA